MDSLRDKTGLIDVKKLIASYDADEHRAQADAYFSSYTDDSVLLRKPFQSVDEAVQITQGLSIMLREAKLFRGAKVMDFGAGTAWLSRILAYLNCEPIAVDLSRSALELGRRVMEKDPLAHQLKVSYLAYDGVTIPLPDASVDRVCCFDAFHHVADQRSTLREFHRIMKPGTIAAFHEPGPYHSRSRDSQYEMENYRVIENDIFIEEIWNIAKDIGFRDMKVAWYTPAPRLMSVSEFDRLIVGDPSSDEARSIVSHVGNELQNVRVFFLYKAGQELLDSRRPEGLAAKLEVRIDRREGNAFIGTVQVSNVGTTPWLPSGTDLGCVRVGVQLKDEVSGKLLARDYARISISQARIEPGETATASFAVPVPDATDVSLVFDLVAEYVIWFSQLRASTPVTFASTELPA